jgi:hypothetical protein
MACSGHATPVLRPLHSATGWRGACLNIVGNMSGRGRAGRKGTLVLALALAGMGPLGAARSAHAANFGAWSGAARLALAGPATPTAADPGLAAECAQLRAQLDQKAAEISALKRGSRGVRQDYELRQRMAEANDLARRLTALESELGRQGHPPAHAPAAVNPATAADVVDAPSALQARADLLSDEARKLNERAAGMIRTAGQLRTRQALRRKAATVERDPFASLDGAKRQLFVRAVPLSDSSGGKGTTSPTEGATTTASPGAGPATAPPATVAPTTPPIPNSAPVAGSPTPTPQSPGGDLATGISRGPAQGQAPLAPGSLLDPALRAELSRIDLGVQRAGNDPEALEQAARALVNRAGALETQAKALRAKAATH